MTTRKVTVDRKFLLDLADDIYDPKTRQFLRLCDGTLQNGPDPTDVTRPMHCGLGELYFAMTGRQPKEDHVDEEGVVNLTVELSTLPNREKEYERLEKEAEQKAKQAVSVIMALGLPEGLEEALVSTAEEFSPDELEFDDSAERAFRDALDKIPTENDDGQGSCGAAGGKKCTVEVFRRRSRRVAAQLRKAAKHLPA